MIEAAWGAVTSSSVVRRDPAAAGAAVRAAVREGLLQTAGPAALLALQSNPAGREAEALLDGLRGRDWTGDDVLIELLTAARQAPTPAAPSSRSRSRCSATSSTTNGVATST